MKRGRRGELTSHLEDYLVVVYEITKKQPAARVSHIARRMGVSLPSVTNAMKRLSALGMVNYEKYNLITLTDKGKKHAKSKVAIQERFRNFFKCIMGLEEPIADKLARVFSHFVDEKIDQRFRKFYEIMINFDDTHVEELKKFIEESKKMSKCQKEE